MVWLDRFGSRYFVHHHEQIYNAEGHGKVSEDVVAGAATHGAMHAFDKPVEENGMPATHQEAKNKLAQLTSAEVDKIAKQKGLDSIDKVKAQELAQRHVEQALDKSGHY